MIVLKVEMGGQKYLYTNRDALLALEDARLFIEERATGELLTMEFTEMTQDEYVEGVSSAVRQ